MTTIKAGTTTTTAFSVEQDTTGDLVFQAGTATPLTIANTGQVNIADTAAFKVPVGGMNSRPATPANGMLRYNSDFEEFEGYSNSKWNLLTLSSMKLKLDFDQTTTLPAGISFTRATSGTFFNSAGVLTTAGSGVARFNHSLENGVWVNKGLLIEEQRTNSFQRSEEFNDAYWSKFNTTVTANQITSPDGTTTADAVFETTTNGNHAFSRVISFTSTSTSPSSASIFVKANGRTRGFIQFYKETSPQEVFRGTFNLSTQSISLSAFNGGTGLSASITDIQNGWYRISISGYTELTATNHVFQFLILNDSWQESYAGDVTKGFYIWGAQLEAGSFPTSYIRTTDASVTRNADVASMTSTNFSSWYNATEGTTFWQGDVMGVKEQRAFAISDNTFDERLRVAVSGTSGTGFNAVVADGGVGQAGLSTPNPEVATIPLKTYKHSFAYKVNDFAAALDGGTVATDTSGTLPTVNRIYFGNSADGLGAYLNGHIAKFYYWNTRKPNEFLQRVTE
jgi:hypothetical protein